MGIKFDTLEQNNYLTKIVNVYIVHDLVSWPKIPLKNFTLKNYLFGATNIVKNSDKDKWMIVAIEQHLMEEIGGVLVMALLEML